MTVARWLALCGALVLCPSAAPAPPRLSPAVLAMLDVLSVTLACDMTPAEDECDLP